MANESISRRDILRTLAVGAVGGSVLQVIPAEAAEYVHQMVHKEKAAAPAGKYAPKYFPPRNTPRCFFCATPSSPRMKSPVAPSKPGAPEFIDLLTSENPVISIEARAATSSARRRLHGSLRQRFLWNDPEQKRRSWEPDRPIVKMPTGFTPQPGRGLLAFYAISPPTALHQQIGIADPPIHRQHLPPRVPRLPPAAGILIRIVGAAFLGRRVRPALLPPEVAGCRPALFSRRHSRRR